MNRAEELAVLLEENARHDDKTHPESKAAYSRMIDVITK